MKKRLGIAFLAVLLIGTLGLAKTNFFDNIIVDGTATITGAMTFAGAVSIDDTTVSVSTVTGSLHTDGGVGIAKNVYIGTDISLVGLTGVHDIFLTDAVVDALSIQRATTDMVVFDTSTVSVDFTSDLDVNGALVLLDGSTSVRGVSAAFTSLESPANRFGLNATEYMQIETAVTTGITTITHTGTTPQVTWTANSLAFVGDLDVNGATAIVDGSTSVRGVSAGFTSLESPANRLGLNATEYMQIATTITTGITAITHTGSAPTVTWTANSFSLVGSLDVSSFFDMGTMDVGIAVTTADPFAMEVHTEPLTTLTAGATGLTAGIRSRYQVSVAQPNQISVSATESRLRVKHGLADGVHSAVSGVIEASGTDADFTGTATTQRSAGFFALDFDADVTLANDGWLTGVTINSSVNGAVSMAATKFAGLLISTNAGMEAWEQGIVIDDSAAVTGLDIGTCTTDIVLQNGETFINDVNGEISTDANMIIDDATSAGTIYVAQYAWPYTQTGSATVFTVPANVDVVDVVVIVQTVFDGSGTDLFDLGFVANDDAYVEDLDLSSAAVNRTGDSTMIYANLGDVGAANLAITGNYKDQNDNAAAGALSIYLYYTLGVPGAP